MAIEEVPIAPGSRAVVIASEGTTNPARYAWSGGPVRITEPRCLDPLRYSPLADEVRTHQSKTANITTNADRRCRFLELPAWCLVTARDTLQKYSVFLEL
jgi:hypothetical protein